MCEMNYELASLHNRVTRRALLGHVAALEEHHRAQAKQASRRESERQRALDEADEAELREGGRWAELEQRQEVRQEVGPPAAGRQTPDAKRDIGR
jgi:hypothetical protein